MDPLTHGVASFALQRAFFSRASRRSVLLIIAAGLIADLDGLSVAFGPAAYLHCHRAALHSLAFVLLLSLAAFAFSRAVASAGPEVLWRGFSWLAFLRQWGLGACLADDMGLGKTLQTTALLLKEKELNILINKKKENGSLKLMD